MTFARNWRVDVGRQTYFFVDEWLATAFAEKHGVSVQQVAA